MESTARNYTVPAREELEKAAAGGRCGCGALSLSVGLLDSDHALPGGKGFLPDMASSSTSSEGSWQSFILPPSPTFSSLPIMALREKIVEKILDNRVTLIVGETGCGKSSQVPQFLLDKNIKPVLCTQPRRFAVVAVAKMVAKARNCELGGEVGYQIGHSRKLSSSTKIFFKTAGVLLDEMLEKGVDALNYKAIILDEVHERSVESDLVIVCVKQFLLKNKSLRLVLMSATADIERYKRYFGDIGRDERVEVLAIPSSSQHTLYQRKVLYLEQITKLLGVNSESPSVEYCSGDSPSTSTANINPDVQKLIFKLVLQIHKTEPDIEKSILIFLPTYRALEQQWRLLKPLNSVFKVHILHSSVDTEKALMTLRLLKSHRKIILATNIAESSVTIPQVAFVIDSCRSLQVYWDNDRKTECSELVWVSKSQADQRRGRTGRTCDGQIYRLVTGSFFSNFADHDSPAILKLSLRHQVLMICCAESKAINDPKVLLQKALDPPDPHVINDALDLLVQIQALNKVPNRARCEPTFYGRVLSSFPLSFDASILILKFGEAGMLHEGIVLGIVMDLQPQPIQHPFGEEYLFRQYIDYYFAGDNETDIQIGQKEAILVANLCAFKFWQRIFKDKHYLEHLERVLEADYRADRQEVLRKIEEEWCSFHHLLPSSLHHVAELYEDILNQLHRYRPSFLGISDGFPSYYDPYEFQHTCLIKCLPNEDTDEAAQDEDNHFPTNVLQICISVPFVTTRHFNTKNISEKLAKIIKEIRANYSASCNNNYSGVADAVTPVNGNSSTCVYFMKGKCTRGISCPFSHSLQAARPTCKYFFSLQGCRNGSSCSFSHDTATTPIPTKTEACTPENGYADPTMLLQLFPSAGGGYVLIMDDTNFKFTSNIARRYFARGVIATTYLPVSSVDEPTPDGVRILWDLEHPSETIIGKSIEGLTQWEKVKCILWVPDFENLEKNMERQKTSVQKFFEYLALRMLADNLYDLRVVLTMNNIRFSHLQVEKLARSCFFFLSESFPFDENNFGTVPDALPVKKPAVVSRAVSYIFVLHPPTDIQFGDYSSRLQESLLQCNSDF
ncbi:hypothetical protein MLD38_012349 [Melastoma candidum]|uniref:Uncharacterized protein n=1 Tax=Melastoma candidum TaxID=119954 RepID=A0ACB9R7B8_9MYRT|nr:hypothetical protein MLD38_012349 [Melastoma candidum]